MVKRDPDDLISALSKNLKNKDSPVLRFTFKRGGLWKPEYAKSHSRKAKLEDKNKIRQQCLKDEDKQWPLLARYKQNQKEEPVKSHCSIATGKGNSYLQSILSVFRVNFFKIKSEKIEKKKKEPTKPNPESKASIKRKKKTLRNHERRIKRTEIRRNVKKQKMQKTASKAN